MGTQELRDRFLREARATAALRHVNICPIFEIGEVEGQPFIAMAFINGLPLSAIINPEKPLTEKQAANIVRKVALGLAAAHHKNVIHRDLKPDNIMIDRQSKEPVVMDFGLARRDESNDEQLTQEGQIMGTPVYMPPEQARGEVDMIGFHSDIYSLGVILYELLTCRRPFKGKIGEVLAAIVRDEPAAPSKFRPTLDSTLESICLKAMAKQPHDRYQSMEEFAQALAEFIRGGGTSGPNPVLTPTVIISDQDSGQTESYGKVKPTTAVNKYLGTKITRTWNDRTLLQKTAIGLAAASLLIFLSVILLRTKYGYVEIEILDPSLQVTFEGETITADNDGKPIKITPGPNSLFVSYEGLEAPIEKYFELKREGTIALRVTRIGNEVFLLKPGELAPKTIPELEFQGTELVQTLSSDPKCVYELSFSPEGTRLAAANDGASVKVWDPQSGELIKTLSGFETPVLCVAYSPDGKMLATGDTNRSNSGKQRSGTAVAWNTDDWSQAFTVTDPKAVCSLAFSPDGGHLVGGLGSTMSDESITRMEASYERMSSRSGSTGRAVPNSMSFKMWQWGGLMIYDIASKRAVSTPSVDSPRITATGVSPDGKYFATSGFRGELKLRKVSNGEPMVDLVQPPGSQYVINSVAFARSRPILAGGAPNGFLIYNIDERREVLRNTTAGEVFSLCFSEDGRILATGHEGQPIQLWDVATGKLLSTLDVDWTKTTAIEFQPQGDLLAASGESKGDIRIWRINYNRIKQPLNSSSLKQSDVTNPDNIPDSTTKNDTPFTAAAPPIWSHEEIQAGKITAPDLPTYTPIWEDNFVSTRNFMESDGDVTCRIQNGFASLQVNKGEGQFIKDLRYSGKRSDVACLVEAKLSGQNAEGWSFLLTNATSGQGSSINHVEKRIGVELIIGGDGTLRINPLSDSDSRKFPRITHSAIKKGTEANQLLVIGRGHLLEIYVNGEAVCNPIVWQSELTDLGWALGIYGKPDAVAEFDFLKIWPSGELPTISERIAKGQLSAPNQASTRASSQSASDGIVDLYAEIDIQRDAVSGTWSKENGILLTPNEIPRQPPPRLYLPMNTIVPYEYDVELELERKSKGGTGLVFGFLFGGRQGTVHMDSYSSPHLWGINDIDGQGAKENSTRNQGDRLPLNIRKTVKIEIRKAGIRVFCDAEKGRPEQLSTSFWNIPKKDSLFLGSQSVFAIHSIILKPVAASLPADSTSGTPPVQRM